MIDFLSTFFGELSRRKVWLFGGIYLALGWVLLQVAIAVETTLSLPGWVDQIALVMLGLGFPVALLLAWAQESQGDSKAPGAGATEAPANEAHPRLAIAVLPFADMSPGADQEWFSDGISEEILHRLAAEKELKVAGRTSSFQFKGRNASFEEIGESLSVGSVLEGSVRKMENRVRITAQLIEVATGFHIWSGTFDRELEDIFRIQEDISEAIAVALLREIGVEPMTPEYVAHEPNVEAYQALLKGRQVYWTGDSNVAIDWYEKAIELDPDYSVPWVAMIATIAYTQGDGDLLPEGHRKLKSLVADAFKTNPTLVEKAIINAHFAIGEWRFKDALRYFNEVETLGEPSPLGRLSYACLLAFSGRLHLARPLFETLVRAEPLHPSMRVWLANVYCSLGENEKVRHLAQESQALGINALPSIWATYEAIACARSGDMRLLDDLIANEPTISENVTPDSFDDTVARNLKLRARVRRAQINDDQDELLRIYDELSTTWKPGNSSHQLRELADVCVLLGRYDEALERYTFGFEHKYSAFRLCLIAMSAPDWPPRLFLTRDPRGRALMEKAGWDLAWFDEEEAIGD